MAQEAGGDAPAVDLLAAMGFPAAEHHQLPRAGLQRADRVVAGGGTDAQHRDSLAGKRGEVDAVGGPGAKLAGQVCQHFRQVPLAGAVVAGGQH